MLRGWIWCRLAGAAIWTLCAVGVQAQELRIYPHVEEVSNSEIFEKSRPVLIPAGFSVSLPKHSIVRALMVEFPERLAANAARLPNLHLSGFALPTSPGRRGASTVLRSVAADPLGYASHDMNDLDVVQAGGSGVNRILSWRIRRKEQPFVEMWRSSSGEPPPDIRIESPALRYIPAGSGPVRVEGNVETTEKVSVAINGKMIARDVNRDGWGFSTTVTVDPSADSLNITVDDGKGGVRTLLLPVVR